MNFLQIKNCDYDRVIEHLRLNFIADEPLNESLSLCRAGEPHLKLEEQCLSTLKDGLSIMAYDTANNKIAGVSLNGVLKKGYVEEAKRNLDQCSDTKYRKIFEFLYSVNENLDLFDLFSVDQLFEVRMLSVDKDYRGQKLSKQLLLHSEQVAKENQFKVIKLDATSYFTQRVCKGLDYVTIKKFKLSDYRDQNGQPKFPTKEPHNFLKIMFKKVNYK